MDHEPINNPEKSQIHCPYCWKEFSNFEQIGSGIDFKNHLYKDFLVLPFGKATSFPYLVKKKQIGDHQHIESIVCPDCFREYSIALLPFGREISKKSNALLDITPNANNSNFVTNIKNKSIFELLSNWKIFLFFNYFLILALMTTLFTQKPFLGISIYLVLASEYLLVNFLSQFTKEFDQFLEIENKPLVFDQKYLKSKEFVEFKNLFFSPSNLKQKNTGKILKFALVLSLVLFGVFLVLNLQNPLPQELLSFVISLISDLGLLLFFFFFSVLLITILLVLLDSLDYLTLISTKMSLKLDPWANTQKIEIFKKFWIYSLGLYIFSSIILPVFLNYSAIQTLIENYQTPQKFIQLFLPMLIAPFAVLSIIVNSIVIIIFIGILFSFDSNIKSRKSELIDEIKRKISEIKSKLNPSHEDVLKSEVMIKEMDLIEKIPRFFWKLSAIPIIFDALSIGIFLFNLFFPAK